MESSAGPPIDPQKKKKESSASFFRKPKKAKRPFSSEERSKQKQHAELCATLGGEDASVRLLEELVFGAEEQLTERLTKDSSTFLDDDEACSDSSEDSEARPSHRRAAWEDEDDELEEEIDMTHRFRRDFKKSEAETKMTKQKLQLRLKEQFQKAMGGTPSWAEETAAKRQKKEVESEDEDESEELLRRTGNFIGSSDSLPKGTIKIKRCLNANSECPSKSQLTTVQFHPSAQIVMTAGLDHSISLFQVDGKSNPKIQTIHLEKFPVNKASFSAEGEHIVATGLRNKLFYIYDMMEGKIIPVTSVRGLNEQKVSDFQVSPDGKHLLLSGSSGYLHLMTTKTREVIRSMKMNGNVCSAAFTADSSKIFSNSEEGEVFVWDVRSSKCLKRFEDEGCVRGTSLALSRDGTYLACGSQSGVVNIYSQKDCLLEVKPKPLKAVMNLLTAATSLCFNNTAEILAIGSRADNEANRLVHLPSFTVFSNFPQFNKKGIFQTRSLDFSPRSGFYSVANNVGNALLFRLVQKMAENGCHLDTQELSSPQCSSDTDPNAAEGSGCGLSPSQREVLERCLHALTHAKNDSHVLAALLLITRLCPAGQLDSGTLHRIFEAVGLNLPARLLVTAFRGDDSSGLPPEDLISLGAALLAALSTDASMVAHPQLLSTVPLILSVLENGPTRTQKHTQAMNESKSISGSQTGSAADSPTALDEALACDCYQVLNAVCALPQGPEQLLTRGALLALSRAVLKNQTLSREKGLPLLGHLLSSSVRLRAWERHSSDLLSLLGTVSQNFCQASDQARLEMCSNIPLFLPPPGVESESQVLKEIVGNLWASLRPLVQGKISPEHLGPVLVVSACLLDLFGWESTGPPKFCCLLVNRACVEVRMGLEEPPGTEISPQLQHTLTACYRIMEAAMEQACSQGAPSNPAPPQTAIAGLSLQQSRQVLGVLEEAFSAEIYYLKQVDQTAYDDPFLFATFRSLCAWLAEETSCLKDDVIDLLPFLIGYAKSHYKGGGEGKGLADWMSKMSISSSSHDGTWSREAALRYLLPALCHLSAEDGPRRVLLSLDTPALLVDFLSKGWASLRGQSGKTVTRDPSLETTCSALLNFAVTEPERVRKDPCFVALEDMLSEALPVLLHKPRLLVFAANCCTLGLMIGRLKSASTELGQRRFFSSALSFLLSAVQSGQASEAARISVLWEERWEEAGELWRLGLQALAGCVRVQPWITGLIREDGWLQNVFALLGSSGRLPDRPSQEALEEVLCTIAKQCPVCRADIRELVKSSSCGSLQEMPQLSRIMLE